MKGKKGLQRWFIFYYMYYSIYIYNIYIQVINEGFVNSELQVPSNRGQSERERSNTKVTMATPSLSSQQSGILYILHQPERERVQLSIYPVQYILYIIQLYSRERRVYSLGCIYLFSILYMSFLLLLSDGEEEKKKDPLDAVWEGRMKRGRKQFPASLLSLYLLELVKKIVQHKLRKNQKYSKKKKK